ncbi:DEAD-box ATP-dependent RNA helicase 46-like [Magnolia sinica]|uniref:DEAD-box ATP-dependent RNA helicase 46-like n=1 Tax=Magnolia sinica TaxID=86752 RepID=UPI002659EE3D|nr:DEAD-box ATP-dependent RNA helicase 46-like [Magnolia sinica]
MATTESAPTSSGPRYAPEDPSLPKPWKGLIDGSSGNLYYWNPETNVTQYEKPAAMTPPLPAGPPPTTATPKLAPIPVARTLQPNGMLSHPGQQMLQLPGQQTPQQLGQQTPPLQLGQQMPQQQGQQMLQQQGQQMPHQQGPQMAQQQGQHFPHQQMHQMPHQQISFAQGQQITQQQMQQTAHPQGQQFPPQQGQQFGYMQREEIGFQQGKPAGFSLSHSSVHNLPPGSHPVQIPQMGVHSAHTEQPGSSSSNLQQQGASLVQLQQSGMDSVHRQPMGGPMVPNQTGQVMAHNQQGGGPPMGFKMGYEEDPRGRSNNEFYFNSGKGGAVMNPQQPKLAPIPPARNQQEMRIGPVPPQNFTPHGSGLNIGAGHPMPNTYNHAAGSQTFSSNVPMRPSPRILGSPDLTNLSPVEVYRQQHEVNATGDNVPAPFMTFEATGFPPEILREIQFAGFSSPTPIQAQTWPIALQSRDIVAIAKTGSGKTLGYLLPAFIHLKRCRNNSQTGPTVLVLAPTRELATQIQDEAIKFGRTSRISCACLYGGAPKGPQLKDIERGADIVVATPGRLNDILEMKKINFRQVSFLVLDEADRMLDMGFEPQIRKIVNEIPPRRQTLMYTATWPKEVRKIAGDLLVNPVQVNIGSVDELEANKSITQYVEVVPQMEKQRRLEQILRAQERGSKIIIFCSTKRLCDQLARSIGRTFGAAAIHGDKTQGERDWVLNQFRSGKSPILVATDVAARGLDIKDIRVVINYDFPTGIEDYVHRIGRTGRAGATGVSYTFFSDQDWKYAADLVKVLEGANQRVPPEVRDLATRGGGGGFNRGHGGGGRWDSGGRGARDDFGGRGGRNDFGGRGGRNDFGGRGGRNDFGGRGNRGRGFGGPGGRGGGGRGGGGGGRGRHDRGMHDRYDNMDGRGRYDNRRGGGDRNRGRSYSPSPDRVRTWDYDRSRSRSRSRSQSWSRSPSRSRSRSRSYERPERTSERTSGWDVVQNPPTAVIGAGVQNPPPVAAFGAGVQNPPPAAAFGGGVQNPLPAAAYEAPPPSQMSPMSPGPNGAPFPIDEPARKPLVPENPILGGSEPVADSSQFPVAGQ